MSRLPTVPHSLSTLNLFCFFVFCFIFHFIVRTTYMCVCLMVVAAIHNSECINVRARTTHVWHIDRSSSRTYDWWAGGCIRVVIFRIKSNVFVVFCLLAFLVTGKFLIETKTHASVTRKLGDCHFMTRTYYR